MKKTFLLLALSCLIFQFSNAQNDSRAATPEEQQAIMNQMDSTKFLLEVRDEVCKCVDSISFANKDAKETSAEIKKCIDKGVPAYEITMKTFAMLKNPGQSKTIYLNSDPQSNEYKKYYYQIERALMDSCQSVKKAIGSNNKESDYSISKDAEAQALYNKGVDAMNKEDYATALPYFKQAVERDPKFAFAWDNLGLSYRKTGDYDKALDAYKHSIAIDPKGHMPLQNIAIVYEFKKDYDKSLEAYQQLDKVYPGDPETFYGMGRIYVFDKNDMENGLDNMCKAYNIYVQQSSPYRSDAEKQISYIYAQMKKQGKEDKFKEIVKKNNINFNTKD